MCKAEETLGHVPVRDIKKRVYAQHEIKTVIRIDAMQFLKGPNSIGFLPGPAFKVKEIEMRILPDCTSDHLIPVTGRSNAFCLEGWIARGNEQHGIKSGKLQCLFSSAQMAEVDWIKGAA